MNRVVKWIKEHSVSLVCGLLIIALLWVIFTVLTVLAEKNTRLDAFEAFCRKADECALDIAVLSEYEIGQRDPEDNEYRDILREGYPQETRDKVFSAVEKGGCTQRAAVYYHIGELGVYEIVYDITDILPYTAASEYYYLIGDNICVAMVAN